MMMKVLAEAQVVRGKSLVAALAALSLTIAAHAATPHQFLDGKLSWRNIGPNIGGRVVAVTGVPGERNLFYMGAVGGGIWKSTDYGVAWHNISDGKLPSASDSPIAVSKPRIPNGHFSNSCIFSLPGWGAWSVAITSTAPETRPEMTASTSHAERSGGFIL